MIQRLKAIGVELLLNKKVESESEGTVNLEDGKTIKDVDVFIEAYSKGANTSFIPAEKKTTAG